MELQLEFELWFEFELWLWLVGLNGDVEGRAECARPWTSARHSVMWRP